MKFCPLTGKMIKKSDEEMRNEKDMSEDEITMNEVRKFVTHVWRC